MRFFHPKQEEHVSHLLVNWQNHYRKDTRFIEVESIIFQDIMNNTILNPLPLIKLDIEGAENSGY